MIDAQFKEAMRKAGLVPPDTIEPGKFHRFSTNREQADNAGWCKLFSDGRGGMFGDHRSGLSETWQAEDERPNTPAESEAERGRYEQEQFERDAKRDAEQKDAKKRAASRLERATGDVATHPYAQLKRVSFGPLVKRGGWYKAGFQDALLVPIYGADGSLWTVQAINAGGDKDYLKGGRKGGGFHPFGKIRGAARLLIGEGLATVAAAVDACGLPGVVAMDCDNLESAARTVRKFAPGCELIFLADNDIKPDGSNPGIKAARAAAQASGGRVAVPDLDGRACDWWDVWKERGQDAVRAGIEAAAASAAGWAALASPTAADPRARGRLRVVNGEQLLAEVDSDVDWLVELLAAKGAVTAISAPRGLGKSHLTLAMAVAVATGGEFLGRPCSTGRVLYIDRDNPRRETRRRLKRWRAGHGLERLDYLGRESAPALTNAAAWEALGTLGYDLIVLDAFGSATEGIGDNDAGPAGKALASLRDAAAGGAAVVVLLNTPKGAGQYRGSGLIADRIDMLYEARDATDHRPRGGVAWWSGLPEAGEAAWSDRAARRKRRESYRLALVPTKFRLGEEPEPIAVELRLGGDHWSIADVTLELAGGAQAAAEADATSAALTADQAREAVRGLIAQHARDGQRLTKGDAVAHLRGRGHSEKAARALVGGETRRSDAYWTIEHGRQARGRPQVLVATAEAGSEAYLFAEASEIENAGEPCGTTTSEVGISEAIVPQACQKSTSLLSMTSRVLGDSRFLTLASEGDL